MFNRLLLQKRSFLIKCQTKTLQDPEITEFYLIKIRPSLKQKKDLPVTEESSYQ